MLLLLHHQVFNGLLGSLIILHIIWGSIILRMVYKFLFQGGIAKDERSESDQDDDETVDHNTNTGDSINDKINKNGKEENVVKQVLHAPKKYSELDKIVDSPRQGPVNSSSSSRLKGQ
jgi:hypothetical protein